MTRTIRDEDPTDDEGVAFEGVRVARDDRGRARATAKAMLCVIPRVGEHWIPFSQVHENSELYLEDDGTLSAHEGRLVIKRWLAEQKGLAK